MNEANNSAQAPQSAIPKRIGHYEIGALIGRGGMGDVYLAKHPMLGKRAALKVLKAELCRIPEQVARFQQEAMAVCRIGHPAIVDVFDFGALPDGRVYYLMEYLDGQNLADLLQKRGTLSTFEALDIIAPAAEGLQAAHDLGIVHRDVKPENIFIKEVQGTTMVKVLDFGIAKLLDTKDSVLASATKTGMILGTPAYMAPEQAAGRNDQISPATDVYALGIVFYQMVEGRPPFLADSQIEVLMHQLKTPAPGLTIPNNPRLAQALDPVLKKALAKAPARRYQTMAEFLGALRRAVQLGPTVQSAPPSREQPTGASTTRPHQPSPSQDKEAMSVIPVDKPGWPGTQPGAVPSAALDHATGPGSAPQDTEGGQDFDAAHSPTMPSSVGIEASPIPRQDHATGHVIPMDATGGGAVLPADSAEGRLPKWARLTFLVMGITILAVGAIAAATVISVRMVQNRSNETNHETNSAEKSGAQTVSQALGPEHARVSAPPQTSQIQASPNSQVGESSGLGQRRAAGNGKEQPTKTTNRAGAALQTYPPKTTERRQPRAGIRRTDEPRPPSRRHRTTRSPNGQTPAPHRPSRSTAGGLAATTTSNAVPLSSSQLAALHKPKKMTKFDWIRRRTLLLKTGDEHRRAHRYDKAARYYWAYHVEYGNPNVLRDALSAACLAHNRGLARKIWTRAKKFFSDDTLKSPIRTCQKAGISLK